jgi:hypothetical protein
LVSALPTVSALPMTRGGRHSCRSPAPIWGPPARQRGSGQGVPFRIRKEPRDGYSTAAPSVPADLSSMRSGVFSLRQLIASNLRRSTITARTGRIRRAMGAGTPVSGALLIYASGTRTRRGVEYQPDPVRKAGHASSPTNMCRGNVTKSVITRSLCRRIPTRPVGGADVRSGDWHPAVTRLRHKSLARAHRKVWLRPSYLMRPWEVACPHETIPISNRDAQRASPPKPGASDGQVPSGPRTPP